MDRSAILAKIKALLAKTEGNGCTEAEAMTAATMAQKLMEKYQIDMAEANVEDPIKKSFVPKPRTESETIRFLLSSGIEAFCNVKAWRETYKGNPEKHIVFLGAESDVIFATWLVDALEAFIVKGANDFVANQRKGAAARGPKKAHCSVTPSLFDMNTDGNGQDRAKAYTKHHAKSDRLKYIKAASWRIAERLEELGVIDNDKALAISKEIDRMGLSFRQVKTSASMSGEAAEAGMNRGNAASFNRPVNGGGKVFQLN